MLSIELQQRAAQMAQSGNSLADASGASRTDGEWNRYGLSRKKIKHPRVKNRGHPYACLFFHFAILLCWNFLAFFYFHCRCQWWWNLWQQRVKCLISLRTNNNIYQWWLLFPVEDVVCLVVHQQHTVTSCCPWVYVRGLKGQLKMSPPTLL